MTSRDYIRLKTKLAAALCCMLEDDGNGQFVPIIPHDDAKRMTEDQVLSLFQWDHYPIRKADGGSDAHHNLTPRLIVPHRQKTATVDVPQLAKTRRLIEAQEEFRRKVLARPCGQKRERSGKIPSRPFQKRPRQRRPI